MQYAAGNPEGIAGFVLQDPADDGTYLWNTGCSPFRSEPKIESI